MRRFLAALALALCPAFGLAQVAFGHRLPEGPDRPVRERSYHIETYKAELRFDMADGEFTHEGDRCSFETLLLRGNLGNDAGLTALGEIIHDLDIADGKFNRPETPGVGAMLSGVCAATDDDLERIARAGDALDQFYAFFSNRKNER